MIVKDVSAATMFDVLHDSRYRKKWDVTMQESFDIARLSANADVGYYSCEWALLSHAMLCVCLWFGVGLIRCEILFLLIQ